jgi:hypothetical protein
MWWNVYGERFLSYAREHTELLSYHWDKSICDKYGLLHVPGRWGDGLSIDPRYIHYGHSACYMLLNLAQHMGCVMSVLVGYDMQYPKAAARHYFTGLSDQPGEYAAALRKYSTFDGLIKCYETVAKQPLSMTVVNATPDSALTCFPHVPLERIV